MNHLQQARLQKIVLFLGTTLCEKTKGRRLLRAGVTPQHWAAEDALSWYQLPSLHCKKGEKKSLP